MKKGLLIFSLMIPIIGVGMVYALVCGHISDSLQGFGEVKLGVSLFPCNNNYDGVCPEDYEDYYIPMLFGNCSNCPDPDCLGNISGQVLDDFGKPLPDANISTHPIRWNITAPSMEKSTLSNGNGNYIIKDVVSGTYYVSGSKAGFDTELKLVTINVRKNEVVDFNLQNGTCHDDCTNSYGRCNALCDGMNFSTGPCKFSDLTTKTLCHNRMKGTTVYYGPAGGLPNYAMFVDCCEGDPTPRYYVASNIDTSAIKKLAIVDKIVRYDEVPVKIVVAYWTN